MKISFLGRYEDQDLSDEYEELGDGELQSMTTLGTFELKRYLA
jgi:hypothetical protein